MYCRRCGTKLRDNVKFCPKCGASIRKKRKRTSFPKWGVFICIIAILLLGGAFSIARIVVPQLQEEKQDQQVVEDFLEAYTHLEEKRCAQLLYRTESVSDKQNFSDLQKLLAQGLNYEVTDVSQKKDYAVVEVKIENIDFSKVMERILEDHVDLSEKQFNQEVSTWIKKDSSPRREFICKVNVFKVGGERKIEITESFSNALLGGFPEYIALLMKGN